MRPIDRLLASRRLPLVAFALAALLCLPALRAGLFGDDYVLLEGLQRGDGSLRAASDLYRITPPPALLQACKDRGLCPWFTDPAMKLALWRPLSSLLFAADLKLFGKGTVGPHQHSVLWFLAVVLAASLLLRRALPGAAGGLALLLFAVDEVHWMPIAWLANRHALVAAAPALLGLAAHVRWREERWRPGLPLSLFGYAVGLLGGETAVQALAYLFAYELWGAPRADAQPALRTVTRPAAGALASPRSWLPRLPGPALLPGAALLAGYVVYYKYQGYGASHHDHYLDPFAAPLQTLAALVSRLPLLLGDLLGGLPSELSSFVPSLGPLFLAVALAVTIAVAALLRFAWPQLTSEEARNVRWLGLGGLLSLLPGALGPIGSRTLLVPSLGGAAVVAAVLLRGRDRLRSQREPQAQPVSQAQPAPQPQPASHQRLARAGLAWLLAVHAILAPVLLPCLLFNYGLIARATERLVREAEVGGEVARAGESAPGSPAPDVIVLAVPDLAAMLFPPIMADLGLGPRFGGWWNLSMAPADHLFVRTGPASFTLEALGVKLHQSELERFFRSTRAPLLPGAVVELSRLRIEVLSASTLSVTAARPLEDPSMRFLSYQDGGLRRIALPPVGGSLRLPRQRGPLGF